MEMGEKLLGESDYVQALKFNNYLYGATGVLSLTAIILGFIVDQWLYFGLGLFFLALTIYYAVKTYKDFKGLRFTEITKVFPDLNGTVYLVLKVLFAIGLVFTLALTVIAVINLTRDPEWTSMPTNTCDVADHGCYEISSGNYFAVTGDKAEKAINEIIDSKFQMRNRYEVTVVSSSTYTAFISGTETTFFLGLIEDFAFEVSKYGNGSYVTIRTQRRMGSDSTEDFAKELFSELKDKLSS